MELFTSEPSGKKTEGKYKTSFKYDIFIGHSQKDLPVVEKIYDTLQAEGLTCFIASKHVKFGELVTESIKSAIINSMEICMLVTPFHVDSQYVVFESGAAWILDKRITLLLYQISHSKLPSLFWRYQTFEIQDLNKYAKEVLKRKTLLHSG